VKFAGNATDRGAMVSRPAIRNTTIQNTR